MQGVSTFSHSFETGSLYVAVVVLDFQSSFKCTEICLSLLGWSVSVPCLLRSFSFLKIVSSRWPLRKVNRPYTLFVEVWFRVIWSVWLFSEAFFVYSMVISRAPETMYSGESTRWYILPVLIWTTSHPWVRILASTRSLPSAWKVDLWVLFPINMLWLYHCISIPHTVFPDDTLLFLSRSRWPPP